MSFTVVWNPSAEGNLAAIWYNASDRQGVTRAANDIDRDLRRSPQTTGESRSGGRRFVVLPPLAVVFKVDEQDRLVRVLSVRKIEQE